MKTSILLFSILLLAASCSPSRRLEHLVTRHPSLMTTDTITFHDTIVMPTVTTDTTFLFQNLTDTVRLVKDNLRVTLERVHDSIYLQGECLGDTVYIDRKIPVEKIKLVKPDKVDNLISRIPWLISGLIAIVILVIFLVTKIAK